MDRPFLMSWQIPSGNLPIATCDQPPPVASSDQPIASDRPINDQRPRFSSRPDLDDKDIRATDIAQTKADRQIVSRLQCP
jgi:hypothetical protein